MSPLATRDILKNLMTVINIAAHRTTITINPHRGDSRPKKTTDHKAFRTSCIRKTISAIFIWRFSNPLRQTRNAATPISIYSSVHTGANSQLGGEKIGFSSVAYQVGMALRVNIEPMAPAARQATMLTTSFRIFLIFIFCILPDRAIPLLLSDDILRYVQNDIGEELKP